MPTTEPKKSQIVYFAFISRLFVIILQVIFNAVIPNHDAQVFQSPGQSDVTTADYIVSFLFGGFKCWDAQYFIHIAQYGYIYENTLAFFPFFPYTAYILAALLDIIFKHFLTFHSTLLISGVLINLLSFLITAVVLFELTLVIFKDKTFAHIASVLFCINPASIFFSACYSEALFCLLTFSALLLVEKGSILCGTLCIGLSSSTRSNGIVSSGFVLYTEIKTLIVQLSLHRKDKLSEQLCLLFWQILIILLKMIICLLPFIMYQMYAYFQYCFLHPSDYGWQQELIDYSAKKGYKMPGEEISEWCYLSLPLSYTYVQKHHWNVGFLRYYEMKQLPNFLLAFPVIIIIVCGALKYIQKRPDYCWHLGLKTNEKVVNCRDIYENCKCFVYMVHALFITLTSLFFIHVQVTTRLVASSSPVLYWLAASVLLKPEHMASGKQYSFSSFKINSIMTSFWIKITAGSVKVISNSSLAKLLTLYFCLYFVLGIILHVNFLPWT